MSMPVAPEAAQSGTFARVSSPSAMPNRVRTASARIVAAATTSAAQASITVSAITVMSSGQ